jgi:RNA polymerase sigma factor (sigma-70 family)
VSRREENPSQDNLVAKALFERCAAGDPEAWKTWVAQYRPLLISLVRRRLTLAGNTRMQDAEVEDCTADLLSWLLRRSEKLRQYDPRARPSTWLGLLVATVVRDRLRRQGRLPRPVSEEEFLERTVSTEPDPTMRIEDAERYSRLGQAIGELSLHEQLALRMTYVDGTNSRNVGRLLGISQSAVLQLLHRCRLKLRGALSRKEADSTS